MEIRLANQQDIPKMQAIFEYGRQVQIESGNTTQWQAGYPAESLIVEDIEQKAAHVCLDEHGEIIATFSVFTAPDPTYAEIEGQWLNDEEYATIHRLASAGTVVGAGQYCIQWVQDQYDNVRIDTHDQNVQMKHILQKLNFQYCGIIYLANGEARNAYHYAK